MSTAEIREISRTEYADFLVSITHSPFQRMEWLALVERLYPIRVIPLGCFSENRLQAVIPLLRRRYGPAILFGAPLRKCPVPPATLFCAPPTKVDLVSQALETWVRRQGVGYMQATYPPSPAGVPDAGDMAEKLENLELKLSRPLAELWQLLSKKTRYTVRRAVKDGVKLHWAFDADFIQTQLKLLHDTYARQGVQPNYPPALYRALLEKRSVTGLRIMYATVAGRIIAAAWLLAGGDRCYYWDAVTSEEGRRLSANHALVWCLIRWAKRHRFETIDFVGTARGGRGGSRPGIGHFKRSMGALPVEYHIVYWYSPIYRLALSVYRSWSYLKQRLALLGRTRDGGNH
ncbi:MAG TPA: GNAT family N-acetyltransferase [Gammaproteobacteria bacterium]|jgi:hypothetical protein|nr:GNAT family N-acetyltransferase [Gammaproteobacteria bacterium]